MYGIFLVDEDKDSLEEIKSKIDWKNSNFMLTGEATDGERAIPMICEVLPQIVITEIMLPFMNGIELSKILRQIHPEIRIIFVTKSAQFVHAQQALSLGASGYILKPFPKESLEECLKKIAGELDSERILTNETRLLQEKITADRVILKNKFLEDLIQGKLCGNDILAEATDFHFDLLALHYRVILSRISQNQDSPKSPAELQSLIKSALKGWDKHFCLFISKTEFVSILKGNSQEELAARARQSAEVIGKECGKLEKCNIISAIGKNVTHLSEISESYFSARKLMKKFWAIKRNLILNYEDLKSAPLTLTDTEILSERLKYMSHSEIPGIIAEYSRMLEKNQNLFSVIASYLYVDIVKSVSKYLEFLGGKPESLLPEIMKSDFIEACIKNEDIFCENTSRILTAVLDFRDSKMQGRYSDLILKAKEFIAQNYANQSTCLNDVAEEIHLSPNHFSTIFSQECGMTFIEYLTNVRVENAKKLLQDSDKKGYDIAYECGFSDPHYFSFIFKKTTGLTPREYRELQKSR